jgi:hypothetical protein
VSKVCRQVQAGPPHPVRNVYVCHLRNYELHASDGVVRGRHVRRRLPVLVARILVGATMEKDRDGILKRQK